MALDSFNVYHSYLKALEPFSDAECGRLLKACLQYSMTGQVPELRGNERFLFPSWQSQIDRDREKYEAKCRRNSENVSKRWNTAVYEKYERIPTDTKPTKDNDKDKDKDKKENPPNGGEEKGPVPGPDAWFERFWAAYPNQRCGKSSALKAWRKNKPSPALAEAIVAAVERQKGWEQWKRDGGRYIPMATTWLNQCRWDAEDAKPEGGEQIGYFRAPALPPVGD